MKTSSHHGFTITETLIYLALLSLLITGSLVSAYAVAESIERNRTSAHIEQEGNFILGTIRFSLQTAAIENPLPGNTSSKLATKTATGKELLVTSVEGRISIADENGTETLSSYESKDLQFERKGTQGSILDPERIQITFTLVAQTKGVSIERVFSDLIYPNAP